jgi:hypothetical protein
MRQQSRARPRARTRRWRSARRRQLHAAALACLLIGAILVVGLDSTEADTNVHSQSVQSAQAVASVSSVRHGIPRRGKGGRADRDRHMPDRRVDRDRRPAAPVRSPAAGDTRDTGVTGGPHGETSTAPAPAQPAQPAPPRSTSGFPGPASTGVPSGTSLRTSGALTVTRDGTVVDGLDVRGCLTINADRVTVRRSRIRCGGDYVVRVGGDVRGVLLEDVEIAGQGNPGTIAVGVDGFTVRRADIHGVGDGPRMGDATVVEDSWIHGLAVGGGSHNDGIQSTGGRGIVIRHNRIDHPRQQTSCILLGADLGDISGALVTGNLLNGGNYTVYAGADRGHRASHIQLVGNRFGRDFVFGPTSLDPGVTATGNVFDDNGQSIGR